LRRGSAPCYFRKINIAGKLLEYRLIQNFKSLLFGDFHYNFILLKMEDDHEVKRRRIIYDDEEEEVVSNPDELLGDENSEEEEGEDLYENWIE
jgi:hypothetical protein